MASSITHLHHLPMYKILLFSLVTRLMSIVSKFKPSNNKSIVPRDETLSLDIVSKLRDPEALSSSKPSNNNSIVEVPLDGTPSLDIVSKLRADLEARSSSKQPNYNPIIPRDEILSLDIVSKLRADPEALSSASSDFGNLIHKLPAAVLYPSSINDIIDLVKLSYNCSTPFTIAAKGHGHSARGQAMAQNGIVIEMSSLNNNKIKNNANDENNNNRIRVCWDSSLGFYADVGGEQLWIDVLQETVAGHGVAPLSWTDYLYLTVGGTISNAGISGMTFRYGPQISNVYEMDVITGKGELMTCSNQLNSELFFGVLGGLGQFGIITRARIALHKAPTRVKWIRMIYDDFSTFTKDQEHLISIENGVDYVEGSPIFHQGFANNWRSSFFTSCDQSKIASLSSEFGIIYSLEVVKYYDDSTINTIDMEIQTLLEGMNFVAGFMFKRDVSYIDFLNRVRSGELELQSKGQWEVPHPWLNLFVPQSAIIDFNAAVFIDIIHRQNKHTGPILVYPTTTKMWDNRMSAMIPEDEEIFYCVGLLHSGVELDSQNNEILEYCNKAGLKIKQYIPHYKTMQEWRNHFGHKWKSFQERKDLFDPKMILSPGQMIFTLNSYS